MKFVLPISFYQGVIEIVGPVVWIKAEQDSRRIVLEQNDIELSIIIGKTTCKRSFSFVLPCASPLYNLGGPTVRKESIRMLRIYGYSLHEGVITRHNTAFPSVKKQHTVELEKTSFSASS